MKKNIVIVMLSVITMISFLFAFVQKAAADKAKMEAIAQKVIADQNAMMAQKNAEEAMLQRKLAVEQMMLAQQNIQALETQLKKASKK